MKLIIDGGNTVIKIAVFEGVKCVFKLKSNYSLWYENLKKIITQYPKVEKAISSLVSEVDQKRLELFFEKNNIEYVSLSYETAIPFKNLYQTPSTLGVDRIALMASAVSRFKNKNCLVIDAGSCITYDFINSDSEYYGGTISLGLQMRYKSLNEFTAKLPMLSPEYSNSFVGRTTDEAIHSGVCFALLTEIDGVIKYFSNKYPQMIVILTGGDADFLSKRLKNSIFVLPNFLIEGLNHILDYNTNK